MQARVIVHSNSHLLKASLCRTLLHEDGLSKEKAEEPEIKLPTSAGSSKKQESSRKTSISAFLTMPINGDFPGGPVAEASFSQCKRPRFDPWSEDY